VRPSRTVAIAALTAALALGSLPGLAGSREPSRDQPLMAAAFREVILVASGGRSTDSIVAPDSAYASASRLDASTTFTEPAGAADPAPPAERVSPVVPVVPAAWAWKTPRYTLTGYASFYDNGTTAMRLPRGTVVVICGAAGCLERVVTDYGPVKPIRIVDMYRPDFFKICGCGWWSGTTQVTVSVY
jgi:hypothetical protein